MPHLDPEPTRQRVTSLAEDDMQLALSAAAGDALAFETIVRRHNRLLFRTARAVVSDDAEAQDMVQETYLLAFSHLNDYRGDASLGTWLARIAINVALDSLRRKGRLVPMGDGDPQDDTAQPEQTMALHIPPHENPEALAERREVRLLLQASIEGLPVIYRTVFMLRAVEELSVAETAFCLSVSEDVVKTRFLRARAMLRERVATWMETGAREAFAFAGARCDAVLAHVMGELLRQKRVSVH
jgi:RNA polymerase sigma factor (sigma-70 family)